MPRDKLMTGLLAVMLIGTGAGVIHEHHAVAQTSQVATSAKTKASLERTAYLSKRKRVEASLFNNATHSSDPIIRSMAVNETDNASLQKPFNEFFKVFYNWDSQASYVNRPKELTNVATSSVLNNKKYFDKAKDSTGGDIITNEQLNSQFDNLDLSITSIHGSTATVLADAEYESWYTGNRTHGTGETWYLMGYNMKSHKITSMEKVHNLPNNSQATI